MSVWNHRKSAEFDCFSSSKTKHFSLSANYGGWHFQKFCAPFQKNLSYDPDTQCLKTVHLQNKGRIKIKGTIKLKLYRNNTKSLFYKLYTTCTCIYIYIYIYKNIHTYLYIPTYIQIHIHIHMYKIEKQWIWILLLFTNLALWKK